MVSVSDKKIVVDANAEGNIDYYIADIISANDYYPFGMQMPDRKYSVANSAYRYGFNGQENSDEIAAGLTTAMYWEYDSRIGRRWNIDPKGNTWESPYLCFSGNPIWFSDPLGDEVNGGGDKGKKKKNPSKPITTTIPKSPIIPSRPGINKLDQNGPNIKIPMLPVEKPKEIDVLMGDIYGNGHMGPKSYITSLVATIQQNHYDAVGSNIAGGIFGAFGYWVGGDRGSSIGAAGDGIVMSFGGIPDGGSVLSRPVNTKQGNFIPYTEAPISSGVEGINKTISTQKQARHLQGTQANAKNGGGYLNSVQDAQTVLNAVHTGQAVLVGTKKSGQPQYFFPGVTGTNVNVRQGVTGEPTNMFIIKGTTSPSVVPTAPFWNL